MDNTRYLSFHIPEKLRLLVAYRNSEEIFFLRLALESFFEGKFFELVFAPESSLDSRNFETFDALIFCGVSALSPTTIQKTVAYIENGGGLLCFAPKSPPFNDLNGFLRAIGLGEVKPNALNAPTPIDFIDTRHPILDGIFASTAKLKSQLQSAPNTLGEAFQVNEYLKSPIESRILGFQNGKSLLTAARFGNGNVIFSPTLPTKDAASLVLQPIFPPLLFRVVFSIARSSQSQTLSFVAGESGSLALPPAYSIKNELTIEKPSGKTLSPILQRKGNELRIVLSPKLYDELGIYRVIQSNGEEKRLILEFVMNLAPKESDLKSISLEAAKSRLVQSGFDENAVLIADASEKIEAVADLISNSRFGLGIWKYLIALAVALLVFESILGRKTEA